MEQIFNYIFAIMFPFGQDGWKVLSLVSIIFFIKYYNIWKKDNIVLSLVIFLFYGLVLTFFSPKIITSFEEMQNYFVGWLFPFLLGFSVSDKEQKIKILKVYLAFFSFTVFLGFLAYFNIIPDKIFYLTFIKYKRLAVICWHTIFAGRCSFVLIILIVLFLFNKNNNKNKFVILIGILFYLFALLLSGTRACFISVFFIFILTLSFYIFKNKKIIAGISLFILISGLSTLVYYTNPILHNRINHTNLTNEQALIERVDIYKKGINLLKTAKIFGYGPTNSIKAINPTYNQGHFHNTFLQIILDFGIIGFILFCTILFFIFKRLFILYKKTGSVFYLMMIFAWGSIFISEQFDCMLKHPFFAAQYFWITGLILGNNNCKE
ncbi:MAG: O-antigen ligase family protein [Endomicrobiaceae bacterium]|nr:O-antigen ligase family protein [Endomicrobiaceae bacterium]